MIKNKDVVMHAKEYLEITNTTSLEKSCAVPGNVPSSSLENLEVLRRCNSLPLFISSNVFCDWRKKGTGTIQSRYISNHSYRQSVNSTDATTFNYELYNLQSETKSLQELQIEVDALLEFRDLVIETFPDLKNKIISMSSAAVTANNIKLHSSPSRSQTKKKKLRKDSHTSFSVQGSSALNAAGIIGESSPAFVSRSRSNSNSCKKEPKSGEGSGSVVQDSGFSTETTSSKDGHSASSTSGGLQGLSVHNRLLHDSDDELLNLLDVIYRKTSRFRQKFSSMQNYERDKQDAYVSSASISNILNSNSFHRKIPRYSADNPPKETLVILRKERDKLLDKVAELESEMLEGRIKMSQMEKQMLFLTSGNSNLEEQLKLVLSQNQELNSKLLQCGSDSPSRKYLQSPSSVATLRDTSRLVTSKNLPTTDQIGSLSSRTSSVRDQDTLRHHKTPSTRSEPLISGFSFSSELSDTKRALHTPKCGRKYSSEPTPRSMKEDVKSLGKLDGIFSTPKYLCRVRETDSKKITAILLETNTLELQRHLLTLTVQNQVLVQKLDEVLRSKLPLAKRLSGSKEEMTSFRLPMRRSCVELGEVKSIPQSLKNKPSQHVPLNQTETLSNSRTSSNICASSQCTHLKTAKSEKEETQQEEICVDCVRKQENHNQTSSEYEETFQPPKRSKPSKIPLPGTKSLYSSKAVGYTSNGSSPPFSAIHKSLSYSTGNIFFKNNAGRFNRQDSLIIKSRGSSSSISTDSKIMSPRNVFITSPLPKIKRDSVTARVRQLDYLAPSRIGGKTHERSQSEQTGSSSQLIAQNKLNKINSSIISTAVNNSPIPSPSRCIKGKKENSISVATKRSIVLRKESDNKSTVAKKLGHSNPSGVQAFIGGNNNTNSNSSITNSSVNSSLAIDEQYNDVDIGRVRNFRSALLGWLKI